MKNIENYLKDIKMILIFIFFTLILNLAFNTCQAQNRDRFTTFLYTEPQVYFKDGFNIGFGIEYQSNFNMYFEADSYYFPNLRGIDYFDIGGVIGYNYRDRWDEWRLYSGFRLGIINREGWSHARRGFEIGIEHYFNDKFLIGIRYNGDMCEDDKIWNSNATGQWRNNVGLKIGFVI